LHNPHAPPENK